jgi:hypothetical protein
MPSFNDLLITPIKPKVKENFSMAAIVIFKFTKKEEKHTHTQELHFFCQKSITIRDLKT